MIPFTLLMQTVVITQKIEVTVTMGEPRHSVAYWNRKMKEDEDAFLKYNPDANVCMHFAGQKDHAGCHDSYLTLKMYNPAYLKQHPEIKPVTDADWSVSGMTKPEDIAAEQARQKAEADAEARAQKIIAESVRQAGPK